MELGSYHHNCQLSASNVYKMDDLKGTPKFDDWTARPVVDKTVHLLSSNAVSLKFDAAEFTNRSLAETFGKRLIQGNGSSFSALGPTSKRRRCSVVDSALGIMGYDSLKVCETKGKLLVDLLTSFLLCKSSCGRVPNYHGGMAGSSLSVTSHKCRSRFCHQMLPLGTLIEVVDTCKGFFASTKDNDAQVQEVVVALVKVAVATCLFSPRVESVWGIFNRAVYENEGERRKDHKWAVQSVLDFALEKSSIYSKLPPCGRLHFWRIRPLCLKQDISRLAGEAVRRLLLPLDRELFQREEWATIVVSLSLAPEMFTEARRLLHHWLLSSGAVRLWELRGEVAAAVRDVLSHPSVWGLSSVIHLPPQLGFYSVRLRPFVLILEETPSLVGLLRLLKLLKDSEESRLELEISTSGGKLLTQRVHEIDHNSIWSLLTEFHCWFLFALKLLFRKSSKCTCGGDICKSLLNAKELESTLLDSRNECELLYPIVAARYLSWIISPADRIQRGPEEEFLVMLSRCWVELQNAPCRESSLRLSSQHEHKALKSAVQDSFINCTRCGSPVKNFKTRSEEVAGGLFDRETEVPESYGGESTVNVNRWLSLITRHYMTNATTANEVPGYSVERDISGTGRTSSSGGSSKSEGNFMVQYLPLAAITGCLRFLSPETVISLFQFVCSCEGDYAQCKGPVEENCRSVKCLPGECSSCRSLVSSWHVRSQDSGQADRVARSSQGEKSSKPSNAVFRLQARRSPVWLAGVAAVFRVLDYLDSDAILFSDGDLSVLNAEKMRVTDNLAIIVAGFVKGWGERLSSSSLHLESNVYKSTIQDLQTRFLSWIQKPRLSRIALEFCNEVKADLAMRMNREPGVFPET
ncbi:hypothetical protein R1sor_020055 [Riccia sorocarpa]|uniref:Uncharacterized protein n=1 Tax=Riccia sorocarpa TaxID=122646 RepID=A0ABD3IEC8_9MARC